MRKGALRYVWLGLAVGLIVVVCATGLHFGSYRLAFFTPDATPPPSDGPVDRRTVDPELLKAAANMVVPPYGTALALHVDPRRLRAIMEKGEAAYRSATADETQIEGARRIQVAAVLGYGPARRLIVLAYPRSRVIRMVSPAPDTIRFALDGFAGAVPISNEVEQAFGALSAYFAERKEFAAFITHVIDAIRDDSRLQVDKRLSPLFASLTQVEGACVAIARIVAAARTTSGEECSPALQQRVLARVRAAGTVGREDDARRYAIWLMQKLDNVADPEEIGSAKPVVRVLPGFHSVPVTKNRP